MVLATGWKAQGSGVQFFWQGPKFVLVSKLSRTVIVPSNPNHSMGTRGLKLTTSQHVALRLIIRGTVTPPHYTPSCCGV